MSKASTGNKRLVNHHASPGFTLVELMVALAITGIIVAAIYMAYISQQRTYIVQEQVAEMQQNLRASLVIMSHDFRIVGYTRQENQRSNYGITSATQTKFVFTADMDDSGGIPGSGDTMTYELYTPTGASMPSLRRISGQSAIADNIQSIEFQYLDSSGVPITITTAADRAKIRSVRVSILARAARPDRKFTNTMLYTTASGTNWGPYNDNYRRRLLISEINCRNMGL